MDVLVVHVLTIVVMVITFPNNSIYSKGIVSASKWLDFKSSEENGFQHSNTFRATVVESAVHFLTGNKWWHTSVRAISM